MSTSALPPRPIPAPTTVRYDHAGRPWSFRVAPGFSPQTAERVQALESRIGHARTCEAVAEGRLEVMLSPILPEDVPGLSLPEAHAWWHLVTAMLRAPVHVRVPTDWSDALLLELAGALKARGDVGPVPRSADTLGPEERRVPMLT